MKLTGKHWKRINQTIRDLKIDNDSRHINHFRFHPTEGKTHRDTKFRICGEMYDNGRPFLCEAFAENRKHKFDIVDLLDGEVIEVDIGNEPDRKGIPTRRVRGD